MLHVFYVIIFFHSSMLKLWFLISSILSLSLRVLSHLFSICLTWSDLVSPQFISSMLSMPFLILFCLVSSLCFSSLVLCSSLLFSCSVCRLLSHLVLHRLTLSGLVWSLLCSAGLFLFSLVLCHLLSAPLILFCLSLQVYNLLSLYDSSPLALSLRYPL